MTLVEIDEFFQKHPLKERYFECSESERAALAAVAERDVAAAIANVEQISEKQKILVDAAIAEQTVFLMLNPEYLTGNFTRTEAVGAGAAMRRFSDQTSPLGQRAAALIAPLLVPVPDSGTDTDGSSGSDNVDLPPTVALLRG